MSTKAELQALLERVKAATGADRELDAHIFACSQGGRIHYFDAKTKEFVWEKPTGGFWIRDVKSVRSTAKFTASLDAITALIEREFDGSGSKPLLYARAGYWNASSIGNSYLSTLHIAYGEPPVMRTVEVDGATEPLALAAAFLSAMITQMEPSHAE